MDIGRDNGATEVSFVICFPCWNRSVTVFQMSIVPSSERSFNR